jgi:hypothetical protein
MAIIKHCPRCKKKLLKETDGYELFRNYEYFYICKCGFKKPIKL